MNKTVAVIRGDGIGPEIVEQALKVLHTVGDKFGHEFSIQEFLMGGIAIDKKGDPLPKETLDGCLSADAVLLGAVGGPKWEHLPGDQRPEKGLLRLRKGMGLFANLRPARLIPALKDASPLEPHIAEGIDFLVVRELIGGVYFGAHVTEIKNGEKVATDTMSYSEHEIRRIMHNGFKAAGVRRGKVTSVDKANVLDTSRLWRAIAEEVAKEYPEVEFENMLVDNAAMQMVRNPSAFDVVVTENMFGDILSDEASMITGSIGMIPSASLGEGNRGLYEPIHGSAPDIAGNDVANPSGTILSVAMMLRYSFSMQAEADAIETAVDKVLQKGLRTADIMEPAGKKVGCQQFGQAVVEELLLI